MSLPPTSTPMPVPTLALDEKSWIDFDAPTIKCFMRLSSEMPTNIYTSAISLSTLSADISPELAAFQGR